MTVMTSTDVKRAGNPEEPFRLLAGKAADYIRELAAANAGGTGWCQGRDTRDGGARVCMMQAAISRNGGRRVAYEELRDHLRFVLHDEATYWNDHPDRTESEVLGVLDAISEGWL
jgi:hypothetical protein